MKDKIIIIISVILFTIIMLLVLTGCLNPIDPTEDVIETAFISCVTVFAQNEMPVAAIIEIDQLSRSLKYFDS